MKSSVAVLALGMLVGLLRFDFVTIMGIVGVGFVVAGLIVHLFVPHLPGVFVADFVAATSQLDSSTCCHFRNLLGLLCIVIVLVSLIRVLVLVLIPCWWQDTAAT